MIYSASGTAIGVFLFFVALVLGISLYLGRRATLARPIPVARAALPDTGFARVLFRKYYVDEIYNALLVRPLPYQQPSRLVLIWERFASQGLERIPVSAPEYLDLEKQFQSSNGLAAFTFERFNLGGGDVPERISGAAVSPSLFPLLGIEPIKGRTFAREEQGQGHDDVIVISERLWKRRFNSDPTLVGKSLLLNGRNYTVVGVMPAKFEFPIPLFGVQGNQFAERVDIWKPIAFTPLELKERGSRSYALMARLRADVSAVKAQAELDQIISNWIRAYPDNYRGGGFGARIYPFQSLIARKSIRRSIPADVTVVTIHRRLARRNQLRPLP